MNIELNRIHTRIEILEKYGEEIKNIYKFNEQIQNNFKLMLEELKEEINKRFRIADKTIQGNSIRLDNFEQIAEEMRRLKRKEPTMLELQKFEEKWKQNNEDIITKLRLLENALHNRTERILRLESFNADINNFGENSKRLRQFEKEWRLLGGIEELNKKLKNIELNTKTINLHEKEIQKFKLDIIRLSNENNTRIAGRLIQSKVYWYNMYICTYFLLSVIHKILYVCYYSKDLEMKNLFIFLIMNQGLAGWE
ncbi:unnamed protein product [Meloidogyne enterolobii]|uniref:Uncharacterized protein n=1 Tax=Meloidogyne enterolobii TaxID=390850 RepID=A0ACB0YAL1_MELEN